MDAQGTQDVEDVQDAQKEGQTVSRSRITSACEACRAAKVKCQPSNQSGICQRCNSSKRECIFKSGPRTRRSRQSKVLRGSLHSRFPSSTFAPRSPPPPGPSQTFTIDIPMPANDDCADSLEDLCSAHAAHLDELFPPSLPSSPSFSRPPSPSPSCPSATSSLPAGASALRTPPASSPGVASMGMRPRFNLASAGTLLARFRDGMLARFPAVAAADWSVASMAERRPFVLLAVLAAASGTRTLQGHSLYDEEFRKILGLKIVAAGERSLELLQGLLIYCAWYPFHLRPRNIQVFQYVRMAADLVRDLELDQDPGIGGQVPLSDAQLEELRTYLATYHQVSYFGMQWKKTPTLPFTEYTAKCCDILETASPVKEDRLLAWIVRFQHIRAEINDFQNEASSGQPEYQSTLIVMGIEAQLNEWEARMSPDLLANTTIHLNLLFLRILLLGAPVVNLPAITRRKPQRPAAAAAAAAAANPPSAARLTAAIPLLRAYLEAALGRTGDDFNSLPGADWGAFIVAVILGFRLSFALPECRSPPWGDARARAELRFGEYLERMGRMGEAEPAPGRGGAGGTGGEYLTPGRGTDVLGASKVVLGVVRRKYEKRLARAERDRAERDRAAAEAAAATAAAELAGPLVDWGGAWEQRQSAPPPPLDRTMQGCPMMDGSLNDFFPLWDESFTVPGGDAPEDGRPGVDAQGSALQDLWGAMTLEWTQQTHPEFDFGVL